MFVERSVNSEYHNLHSFEHLQYEYLIIFGYDIIKIIKITLFVKKLSTHCLKLQILFNEDIELQFFYKFMIEGYSCKNDKLLRFDFYFFWISTPMWSTTVMVYLPSIGWMENSWKWDVDPMYWWFKYQNNTAFSSVCATFKITSFFCWSKFLGR